MAKAPTRWVALLRAVNLGGRTQVDQADLVRALERVGFRSVRSVLNSGNLLFESHGRGSPSEAEVEEALSGAAGRPLTVLLRDARALSQLVSKNPFPDEAREDPGRLTVAFLKSEPTPTAWASLPSHWDGGERLVPQGAHAFVYFPHGQGRSKLAPALLEKRLGVPASVRNWNTVTRLVRLLNADPPESARGR